MNWPGWWLPPRTIRAKLTPRVWVFVWMTIALILGMYIVLDGWAETDRANRNANVAVEAKDTAVVLCAQIETLGYRCVVSPETLPTPDAAA